MKRTRAEIRRSIDINKLIALAFLALITIGTLLLALPVSARNGRSCGLLPALFTATSATCVTGLVLYDTWSQFSGFGQAVILCLIEIGGLGFMSIASVVIMLLRQRAGMVSRMVMAQSLGEDDTGSIVHFQKWMLKSCLLIEGIGAAILTARFATQYEFTRALKLGVFHSISAFCNAGFDLFGFEAPGASASLFGTDPTVLLPLSALVIVGGLGFVVWSDVLRKRSLKKLTVYTKLVLIATGGLLLLGWVFTAMLEWNNPATIGNMTVPQKLLASFFQSVTVRTAGFAGIDQGSMTEAGKAVSLFLMLIGGSSGSTAGGLKTVTLLVIVLFTISRMRGQEQVVVFHRTIPRDRVMNALSISGIMVALAFFGAALICATSPVSLSDALYETTSAIATVGLSCSLTPTLSVPAKLLLIVYMYFGRVGVLTISLGFLRKRQAETRYKYAETNILIG